MVFLALLFLCLVCSSCGQSSALVCNAVAASPALSNPFQDLIQQSFALSTHAMLLHGAAPPMTLSAVEWASATRTVITSSAVFALAVDSQRLVFSTTDGLLFVSDALGRNVLQLTTVANQISNRLWVSANHAAFIDDKVGGLFVVPLVGGNVVQLTQPSQALGLTSVVQFSPDGNWIAFVQAPQSASYLLVARVNGAAGNAQPMHTKQIGGTGVSGVPFAWSNDSRLIAYAAYVGTNNFLTGFTVDPSQGQDSNIAFTGLSNVAGAGVDGAIVFSPNNHFVVFAARLEPSPNDAFQCLYAAFPGIAFSYYRLSKLLGTDVGTTKFVLSPSNFVFYVNGMNQSLWKQAIGETDVNLNQLISTPASEPVFSILSPDAFLTLNDPNAHNLFYIFSGLPTQVNPSNYTVQRATFLSTRSQALLYGGPTSQMMLINYTSPSSQSQFVTTDRVAQYLVQPLGYAIVYSTSSNVVFASCLTPRIIAPSSLTISASSPVSITGGNYFIPSSTSVFMDKSSPPLTVTGSAVIEPAVLQLSGGFCSTVTQGQPVNFTAVQANFVQGQFGYVQMEFCGSTCPLFASQTNTGGTLVITVYQVCSSGLSGGAIAGIVIGSVFGVLLIVLLLALLIKRGRERKQAKAAVTAATEMPQVAADQETPDAPTKEDVESSHKDLY